MRERIADWWDLLTAKASIHFPLLASVYVYRGLGPDEDDVGGSHTRKERFQIALNSYRREKAKRRG